jgi:general secretion pathway protein L
MPKYVGLDIGAESVKVAVVRTAYRKTTLEGLGKADIAAAGGVPEAAKEALLQAMGGAGIGDGIATSIEGARVAVRTIEVPTSAHRQLAEVLPFEIEAVTPLDMAEHVFDYRVLGTPAKGDTEMKVLIAAARTEDVRARIDAVKAAVGAEPERVGVGAFPIAQLGGVIPQIEEKTTLAILDLGKTGSELLIMQSGESISGRSLVVGTEGLPQTAPKLAREIRVSLTAHKAQGGEAPTVLYLCGGGAFVTGAESFLSAELEMPVRRLPDPFPALELAEKLLPHASQIPLYAKALGLAVGLAGRGNAFDLRRGPLVYERGYGWIRERAPMLAGLGAAILVSFVFSTAMQLYSASKEHEALENALASVSKEVLGTETREAAKANELLAQQTGSGDDDPMLHADAFDVMVRISEAIPQSMVHDIEELDYSKSHVVIHGIVGTVGDAQSIASSLGKSDKCLQDVKITRTSQMVGGDRQKYVMDFDVKCPEDQKGAAKKTSPGSPSASASGGK